MDSALDPIFAAYGRFVFQSAHLETLLDDVFQKLLEFDSERNRLEHLKTLTARRKLKEIELSLVSLLGLASKSTLESKHTHLAQTLKAAKEMGAIRNCYVHCHVSFREGGWLVRHKDRALDFTERNLLLLADDTMKLENELRMAFSEALGHAKLRKRVREEIAAIFASPPG